MNPTEEEAGGRGPQDFAEGAVTHTECLEGNLIAPPELGELRHLGFGPRVFDAGVGEVVLLGKLFQIEVLPSLSFGGREGRLNALSGLFCRPLTQEVLLHERLGLLETHTLIVVRFTALVIFAEFFLGQFRSLYFLPVGLQVREDILDLHHRRRAELILMLLKVFLQRRVLNVTFLWPEVIRIDNAVLDLHFPQLSFLSYQAKEDAILGLDGRRQVSGLQVREALCHRVVSGQA